MSVSKRTRYEILRRDAHTCRYCGAKAPDVPLRVDHVVPVALGGSDEPANLVTACQDCNAGKASTSPDEHVVADVREDALRHAELVRQAYAVLVERMGERNDYIDAFAEAYTYEPLPSDWRHSVGRWFEMGVPVDLLTDAAEIACSLTRTFKSTDRFAYMCGIVWKQVRMVSEEAEARAALDGRFFSEGDLLEEKLAAFNEGWDRGWLRALADLNRLDAVSAVVDRIEYPPDPWVA